MNYMGTGFGYGFSLALILTYLIKFLFIVFIIGLVGGLVVAVKNSVFTAEDIDNFKSPFRSKKAGGQSPCTHCGKPVNEDWKACPFCGTAIGE